MWPERISTEEELDELLTRPSPVLIDAVRGLSSPLLVLGAGGKMGPTLAVMAKRAALAGDGDLEVIAVSRFSDTGVRDWLQSQGVQTLSCDLLDRQAIARLPQTTNIIYMVGAKFGTTRQPAYTWAVNTLIPAYVAESYCNARIVALSSGNVYPLVPVDCGGSQEMDPLTPLGEYANSCVARERVLEFFSTRNGTPMVLIRLNYAVELRYGVLVDIAQKVWTGQPVDVTTGYFNCIWQRDANEMILRTLAMADVPPLTLNITGAETLSVRWLAHRFGELLDKEVHIAGQEAETALLSNSAKARSRLGDPPTPIEHILRWTAQWLRDGGRLLAKPTHFEVRDGRY